MAGKTFVILALLAAFVAFIIALPVDQPEFVEDMEEKIKMFREAIVKQDVMIGMDSDGKIILPDVTPPDYVMTGRAATNLSSILAAAPTNTVSMTFIPLIKILFPNGIQTPVFTPPNPSARRY